MNEGLSLAPLALSLASSEYWLTRLVLQRGLAFIYLIAFLVALNQFRPLCGERGLLPAPRYLRLVSFREAPSLFHFFPTDKAFALCAWIGILLSVLALSGLTEMFGLWVSIIAWFVLWALYLSYVNIGQTFYGFGWESILLESGFLAIFLGSAEIEPPLAVIWLFRWVAFRVMFGAGLIKLRGDPCWKDLSCLDYHFETQPMPNPLSSLFHRLPRPVLRGGVLMNHVAELLLPPLYFLPQPFAGIAGVGTVLFLFSIIVSGNFAWLNWMTVIISLSTIDDTLLSLLIPIEPPLLAAPPLPFRILNWGLVLMVAVKSKQPVMNMLSPNQVMNTTFDPLHLVNTYGAFGSITRERYEIVLEGTADEDAGMAAKWTEYEFRGKPGRTTRMPPQIAPYHLRLDWLMWFAAMPSPYVPVWLLRLVAKLLEGDAAIAKLLKENPFPDAPPRFIRARYYLYRFPLAEEREKGVWWQRELIGNYLPPMSLSDSRIRRVLER